MSFARFANKNRATIWPHLGFDEWNGGDTYDTPVQVDVSWIGKAAGENKTGTNQDGSEFVVTNTFWMEYAPKRKDRIAKGEHTGADWMAAGAEEIRQVIDYEMAWLNDTTDYEVLT